MKKKLMSTSTSSKGGVGERKEPHRSIDWLKHTKAYPHEPTTHDDNYPDHQGEGMLIARDGAPVV